MHGKFDRPRHFVLGNFQPTTPNYLMKVDDDTFVNLPRLYQTLMEDKKYKDVKNLLMGHCFCHGPKPFLVCCLQLQASILCLAKLLHTCT